MADNSPAGESADKDLGGTAPESVPTPAPISESAPPPSPTRGVPLITFDMSEETDSKWEKIGNFFKSTIGKIVIFTVLFLGIAFYILTTSNVILFQGRVTNSTDLIAQQSADATPPPQDNKVNPFIGENASTLDTTKILDLNQPISTTQNGLIANSNITGVIDQNILQGVARSGDVTPNTVDDGAPSPTILPAAPTALTTVCGPRGTSVVLRWLPSKFPSPLTYGLRLDNLRNGWALENSPLPPNPGDLVANDLTTSAYTATIVPNQEYKWWVNAVAGDKKSPDAIGTNFTCPSTSQPIKFTNIDPNIFINTQSPSTPKDLKAICEPSAKWVGLEWTSGSNSTTDTYKVSIFDQSATSDVLPAPITTSFPAYRYSYLKPNQKYIWRVNAVNSTGKMSDPVTGEFTCTPAAAVTPVTPVVPPVVTPPPVQPVTPAPQTLCPDNTYLNGGAIPADCKSVPTITGLTGDNASVVCSQLKTLYGLGAAIKMNGQTIDNLLMSINGPVCTAKPAPTPTVAPDGQLIITSGGGNDATSGTTNQGTSASTTTKTQQKTSGSALVALENQASDMVVPSHPVAGKQKPHGTASTGPEMWIYGIGAAMSYYGARRKKSRK